MPMSKTTSVSYKDAIRFHYEMLKKEDATGFFSDLTPAVLRDLCLKKYDTNLNPLDKEIFKQFFAVTRPEDLRNAIFNFDITKFKAIQNFLNSDRPETTTSSKNLNLIAVLIDYELRPYGKYKEKIALLDQKESYPETMKLEHEKEPQLIHVKSNPEVSHDFINVRDIQKKENKIILSSGKIALIIFLPLFAFFSSLLIYKKFIAHKDCLEWKDDRYIEVDCDAKIDTFVNLSSKLPFNEGLLRIRKIIPTDTTTYFKNGKAIIWYCKISENQIELFNAPGFHPETESPLKPITNYMINKYLE